MLTNFNHIVHIVHIVDSHLSGNYVYCVRYVVFNIHSKCSQKNF